jgi:hypothetical protein
MTSHPSALMPLAAALLLGACAGAPRAGPTPSRSDNAKLAESISAAASQVKRCYRAPRVASAGRQIVTRLLVRFAPDGSLVGMPELVSQRGITPASAPYAARMAEAARLAVLRCAPLRLPPESYSRGWSEFELTFSPRGFA